MSYGYRQSHLTPMNLRLFFVLLPAALTLHWFWQQVLGRTCAKKISGLKIWHKGWKSALSFIAAHFSHTRTRSRVATWTPATPYLRGDILVTLGRVCVAPLAWEGSSESQIGWLTSKHPFVRWIPLYGAGRDLMWIQSCGQNMLSYSQAGSIIQLSSILLEHYPSILFFLFNLNLAFISEQVFPKFPAKLLWKESSKTMCQMHPRFFSCCQLHFLNTFKKKIRTIFHTSNKLKQNNKTSSRCCLDY